MRPRARNALSLLFFLSSYEYIVVVVSTAPGCGQAAFSLAWQRLGALRRLCATTASHSTAGRDKTPASFLPVDKWRVMPASSTSLFQRRQMPRDGPPGTGRAAAALETCQEPCPPPTPCSGAFRALPRLLAAPGRHRRQEWRMPSRAPGAMRGKNGAPGFRLVLQCLYLSIAVVVEQARFCGQAGFVPC